MDNSERFPFECKTCGSQDSVPFRPKNPNGLECRACFRKGSSEPRQNRGSRRDGGRGGRDDRRGGRDNNERFEFSCKSCGSKDSVPFRPKNPNDLECRACFRKDSPNSRQDRGPRRDGGRGGRDDRRGGRDSNERFEFECKSCGSKDSVPFRPKNPNDLKCRACFRKDSPNSRQDRGPRQHDGHRGGGDDRRGGRDDDRFVFECKTCGSKDSVPFRPKNPNDLECRACFRKDSPNSHRDHSPRRDRGYEGRGGYSSAPAQWDIECSLCGNADIVPFEPRENSKVLCNACHNKRKSKPKHIPRLEHGTRVSYPIVCDACSKRESLGYVPNTSGPVYCSSCAAEKLGKSSLQIKFGDDQPRPERPVQRRVVYPGSATQKPRRTGRVLPEDIVDPDRERLKKFRGLKDMVRIKKSESTPPVQERADDSSEYDAD